MQKLAFENEVKLHYIQKWQTARNESNSYKLDVKEDAYSDVIREKNNAIDREARIHAEIETFLSETTQVLRYQNRNNTYSELFRNTKTARSCGWTGTKRKWNNWKRTFKY